MMSATSQLPEWIKLSHFVILPPGSDRAYLIPKPFETGAMFASIPEATLQAISDKDGPKYAEALGFLAANAFGINLTPRCSHCLRTESSMARVLPRRTPYP